MTTIRQDIRKTILPALLLLVLVTNLALYRLPFPLLPVPADTYFDVHTNTEPHRRCLNVQTQEILITVNLLALSIKW